MSLNLPSVWINELTWQEVESYLKHDDIVLIPAGTTEQHGPHAPCGLDTYVAIALAEDTARRAGVLTTPPIWFGDSSHHAGFPGTITIRTETLSELVKDICRYLARHGFRKIIVINGHKGANLPALTSAVRNLHEYELPDVFFAVADPMHLARGIAGKVKTALEHHAGELEVSHTWYKFPHLIRPERLTREHVDLTPMLSAFHGPDLFGRAPDTIEIPWSSQEQRAFIPTGSFSDASAASPEKGREYHDYMVANLVRFIEWLRSYKGPIGQLGKGTGWPGGPGALGRS